MDSADSTPVSHTSFNPMSRKRKHEALEEERPNLLNPSRLQEVEDERRALLHSVVGGFTRATLDQLLVEAALSNPGILEAALAINSAGQAIAPTPKSQEPSSTQKTSPKIQPPESKRSRARKSLTTPTSRKPGPKRVQKRVSAQKSQHVTPKTRPPNAVRWMRGGPGGGGRWVDRNSNVVKKAAESPPQLPPSSTNRNRHDEVGKGVMVSINTTLDEESNHEEDVQQQSSGNPSPGIVGQESPKGPETTGGEIMSRSCISCRRSRRLCDRKLPCALCKSRRLENHCTYPQDAKIIPTDKRKQRRSSKAHQSMSSQKPTTPTQSPMGKVDLTVVTTTKVSSPIVSGWTPINGSALTWSPKTKRSSSKAQPPNLRGQIPKPDRPNASQVIESAPTTESYSLQNVPAPPVTETSHTSTVEQRQPTLLDTILHRKHGENKKASRSGSRTKHPPAVVTKKPCLDSPGKLTPDLVRRKKEADVDKADGSHNHRERNPLLIARDDKGEPEISSNISSDCESIPATVDDTGFKASLHEWERKERERKTGLKAPSSMKSSNVMVVIYQ